MHTFPLAHASASTPEAALRNCLAAQSAVPAQANLGFLYVTDGCATALPDMVQALREHTGIADWVGTVGMGICCSDQEYYDEPALAVMLASFPPDSFRILPSAGADPGFAPDPDGVQFAVVHGDPRHAELPELIAQLPQQLGNGYLVGGLSSSRSHYYQLAGSLTEAPLSGVVFNEGVRVVTGLTQGCTPIGPLRQLTDCQANVAIGIDGRPALDVFYEDIGEILARDLSRAAGYIFAGFPVSGSDTGDYLVRNLIGVDPNRRLLAIGEQLTAGSPIMFCRRDGQTAQEDLDRMLNHIKRRLSGPPKGGVYYSCLGRGRSLFGHDSEEMKHISAALDGQVPLVGFYANGEISGNRLYGYTGVLTLFL